MRNRIDNLENLTNNELRSLLLQYGLPNVPVTDTTRKILVRRLRSHTNGLKPKRRTNYWPLPNSSSRFSPPSKQKSSPKIYVLDSESEEDSDYLNYTHNTTRGSNPDTNQQPERSENNISPSTACAQLITRLKQTFISCARVSPLLLFFYFVAFSYMTTSPDLISTINEKNTVYAICDPHLVESAIATSSYSCIEEDDLPAAIYMLKNLLPELQRRAEQHFCKDPTQEASISARDFVKYLHEEELATEGHTTLKDLHNVEYLIEKNPQWNISHIAATTNDVLPFEEVVKLRSTQENCFAILNPHLPITCTISNKIQNFFVVIRSVTLLAAALFVAFIVFQFIQNRRKSHIDAVEFYTNKIIAELMRYQSAVVVNHLRDKLIPLHKRKAESAVWNEAIQNLELNDSRIQFDLKLRNGEKCKTIKWIANVSDEMFTRTTNTFKQ